MYARAPRILAAVLLLPGLASCASAVPVLAGGATTNRDRVALQAGGAARVPFGDADPGGARSRTLDRVAGAGGLAPVVGARYGVARHWDVGLMVAGTDVRLGARREVVLEEASTRPSLLLGAGVLLGYADDRLDDVGESARGFRFGVDLPLLYAVEFGPVYDVWVGPRLGTEHLRGRFSPDGAVAPVDTGATVLRAGGVVGLGAGFRRLHVQLELTAYYEGWVGEPAGSSLGGGLVLVPAFALRLRI